MPNRVTAVLKLSTAALVLSGYLALATVREYGPAYALLPLAILLLGAIGERLDGQYPAYRIMMRSVLAAYLCFIPLTLMRLGLFDAVLFLVIFLQLSLLAKKRTVREYYYLFLMAFFMVLSASVKSPEPAIGLVFLFFLFSAIWAFIAIRIYEELSRTPDARHAWIPLRLQAQHAPIPSRDGLNRRLALWISLVSILAAAITLAIFFAIPRMEAGFLGQGDSVFQQTGIGQTVDLRTGGIIVADKTPVMRVEFPDLPEGRFPDTEKMYWRCTTLSWYHNSQWNRKGLRDHLEPETPPLLVRLAMALSRKHPKQDSLPRWSNALLIRQNIYVDNAPEEGLPCLDLVRDVRIIGTSSDATVLWDQAEDFTVLLNTNGPRRLAYEAVSEVGDPPPQILRQATENYAEFLMEREFAMLTDQDLLPETRALIQRVVEGKNTAVDKALAIQQWLSGPDFLYTTVLPPLPPRNAIDMFITQAKRGHCELFASAMALSLRSLGIPTRVVRGFLGGERNDSDGSYMIRADMAHLWVEVFFINYGWVAFDPSPRPDASERSASNWIAQAFSQYSLRAKMLWYQKVVGFDRGMQLQRLRDFSIGIVRSLFSAEAPSPEKDDSKPLSINPQWIFALIGASAAALLVRILRRGPRKKAQTALSPDQRLSLIHI